MIVQLDTHRLETLDQVQEFLAGSQRIGLEPQTRADAYAFVAKTAQRFDYPQQGKADKGLLRRFLAKATGLSRAQITRLLRQHRTTGQITDRRGAPRRPFPHRYTKADVGLLAELDALHGTLSGPAARKLGARAFHRFGDRRFEGAAAGAPHRHVHQVPRATQHRQRPGREQERLGRPKASRPRPHPQPLRGAGQRFHPAGPLALPPPSSPLALPQFPPARFFPSETVDAKGRIRKRYRDADIRNSLREAPVVAQRRRLPAAPGPPSTARCRGVGPERQRGCACPQHGPRPAVSFHRPGGLKGTSTPRRHRQDACRKAVTTAMSRPVAGRLTAPRRRPSFLMAGGGGSGTRHAAPGAAGALPGAVGRSGLPDSAASGHPGPPAPTGGDRPPGTAASSRQGRGHTRRQRAKSRLQSRQVFWRSGVSTASERPGATSDWTASRNRGTGAQQQGPARSVGARGGHEGPAPIRALTPTSESAPYAARTRRRTPRGLWTPTLLWTQRTAPTTHHLLDQRIRTRNGDGLASSTGGQHRGHADAGDPASGGRHHQAAGVDNRWTRTGSRRRPHHMSTGIRLSPPPQRAPWLVAATP